MVIFVYNLYIFVWIQHDCLTKRLHCMYKEQKNNKNVSWIMNCDNVFPNLGMTTLINPVINVV